MAINSDEQEGNVERISDYDRMLERRITILETRWDAILPTLATKADLAELKAELKDSIYSESSKLTRWLVTLTVTMIFGFAAMFATMLTLLRP